MTYKFALLISILIPSTLLSKTTPKAIYTAQSFLNQGKKTVEIPTSGMNCLSCVGQIKSTLHKLDGVENVEVNLAAKKVVVTYLERKVQPGVFSQKINELGYKASTPSSKD